MLIADICGSVQVPTSQQLAGDESEPFFSAASVGPQNLFYAACVQGLFKLVLMRLCSVVVVVTARTRDVVQQAMFIVLNSCIWPQDGIMLPGKQCRYLFFEMS